MGSDFVGRELGNGFGEDVGGDGANGEGGALPVFAGALCDACTIVEGDFG